MTNRLLIILLAIFTISASTAKGENQRIMTYNVRNGIGLDGVTDFDRIGQLIKNYRPDVVALQEIDSVTNRSRGRDVVQEIARAAEMTAYFAPAIDYDGGKYGIGILCRQQPLSIKRYPLPGREEARTLLALEFPDYVFACTHLSLTEEDRLASLAVIENLARQYAAKGKPLIIAGDFNDTPESTFIQSLLKNFTALSSLTEPTFPADQPEHLIDYIMICQGAIGDKTEVKKAEVIPEPIMSDHRPIIADIAIPCTR